MVTRPVATAQWVSDRWRRGAGWAFAASLFLAYPLAVVAPVETWSSLVFYFSIPVFFCLSTIALCLLVAMAHDSLQGQDLTAAAPAPERQRLRRLLLLLAGLVGWSMLSGYLGQAPGWAAVVEDVGLFALPLAFAVGAISLTPRTLVLVLTALWAVNAAHGLWQAHVGFELVGLAGNRNWMSTLMVALAPWPLLLLRGWMVGAGDGSRGRSPSRAKAWLALGVAGAVVVGASLWLAWQGHSRATWLVLTVYVLWFIVMRRLSWLGRALLASGLACLLFLGMVLMADKVSDAINDDIRIPLWAQTVRLIRAHPVLGVGPGNFERDFVRFKSTAHRQRLVAAPVTEHPHNEPLRVCAELGVPAGLAYGLLLLIFFLYLPVSLTGWLLHFTGWLLVGHGFFDKALTQPPLSLLACLCLGLLWREKCFPEVAGITVAAGGEEGRGDASAGLENAVGAAPVAGSATARPPRRWLALGALGILVVMGAVEITRLGVHSWLTRRGLLAEYAQQNEAAYAAYVAATRCYPRRVDAHLLAAVVANERLGRPVDSLKHLQVVQALAPDYAHVNGQIGLALGSLGRNAEAWPYFEREALVYFPFDPQARRRYLLCAMATGRKAAVESTLAALPELDRRQAAKSLGAERTQALTSAFRRGLRLNRADLGVPAAAELTAASIHGWGCDPALPELLSRHGLKPASVMGRPFAATDFAYWRAAMEAQRWLQTRHPSIPADYFTDRAAPPTLTRSRLRQAGWCVLVLADDQGHDLGIWELWRGGEHLIVRAADGMMLPVTDSLAGRLKAPGLLAELGLGAEAAVPAKLRLTCPLPLAAFLPHNAILAGLLPAGAETAETILIHALPSVQLLLVLPPESLAQVTFTLEPDPH